MAAFDQDGDNWDYFPGPDCDPNNDVVHPRARDKPGNKVDENCDGRDARFPRVNSEVAPLYLAVGGRTVGFAQFGILPARKGDRVRGSAVGADVRTRPGPTRSADPVPRRWWARSSGHASSSRGRTSR